MQPNTLPATFVGGNNTLLAYYPRPHSKLVLRVM